MNHDGVLRGNNVIKLVPDQLILKLDLGDRIGLSAAQFERLARAFFAEIEAKFAYGPDPDTSQLLYRRPTTFRWTPG